MTAREMHIYERLYGLARSLRETAAYNHCEAHRAVTGETAAQYRGQGYALDEAAGHVENILAIARTGVVDASAS